MCLLDFVISRFLRFLIFRRFPLLLSKLARVTHNRRQIGFESCLRAKAVVNLQLFETFISKFVVYSVLDDFT